jgi:hypothetical protein
MYVPVQRDSAPAALPEKFLTPTELSTPVQAMIQKTPVNKPIGNFPSLNDYLFTHFQLLRYDSFSGLHYAVQFYQSAILYNDISRYVKEPERRKLAR